MYTSIGGKSRYRTSCDLQDHRTQARKSAGEISTLDLKPMRKDTRSPKQEQSVAPQNGPRSKQKIKKKIIIKYRNITYSYSCRKSEESLIKQEVFAIYDGQKAKVVLLQVVSILIYQVEIVVNLMNPPAWHSGTISVTYTRDSRFKYHCF